jgi:hypothetical protein
MGGHNKKEIEMNKVTVNAETEAEAILICSDGPFTPDAVREVDSGEEGTRAWLCFESGEDAELWDNQK